MIKAFYNIKLLSKGLISVFACALVAVSALLLNGCNSTSEVHFERYTLTQNINPVVYNKLDDYQFTLNIPPILAQGGVVLQIDEVSLRPAQAYRYTAELDHELKLLFLDQMIEQNMSKKLSYEVFVSKFQGTIDGQVLVQFNINVKNAKNKQIFERTYESAQALKADGYSALVEQLKADYLTLVNNFIQDFKTQA